MNIYWGCLRGKKKNQTKLKKKTTTYLNLHALMFICCLISYGHDIDSTVDLVEAVIMRTWRRVRLKKKKKEEKQSVVGWFVFVSSLCCVSVFSVDWGSSWVKVQITWRRIGPPAFTLPARRGLKATQTAHLDPPPTLPSPPPPHIDGGAGSWLSVF